MLTGYTQIQAITYFVMFGLSIELNYKMVTAIHLITLFSMLFANVGFGLFLHMRLRKEDPAFKFWTDHNPRIYTVAKWVMMGYSFKSVRILYCNFLSKP